jgi:hypothetical protein
MIAAVLYQYITQRKQCLPRGRAGRYATMIAENQAAG